MYSKNSFPVAVCVFLMLQASAFAITDPELPLEKLSPGTVIRVEKDLPVTKDSFGIQITNGRFSSVGEEVEPGYKCWLSRKTAAIFDYVVNAGTEFKLSTEQPWSRWMSRKSTIVHQGNVSQETSAPANWITYLPLEDNSNHIEDLACWAWAGDPMLRKPVVFDFNSVVTGILSIQPSP